MTQCAVAKNSNSGEMWPLDKRQFQGQSLNTLQDNDVLMYYITHPQGLIFLKKLKTAVFILKIKEK